MCNKTVEEGPWLLCDVPDHFKTQEMCKEAMRALPNACFRRIPDRFKTQDMCRKAVTKDPRILKYIPDHFKVGLACS